MRHTYYVPYLYTYCVLRPLPTIPWGAHKDPKVRVYSPTCCAAAWWIELLNFSYIKLDAYAQQWDVTAESSNYLSILVKQVTAEIIC